VEGGPLRKQPPIAWLMVKYGVQGWYQVARPEPQLPTQLECRTNRLNVWNKRLEGGVMGRRVDEQGGGKGGGKGRTIFAAL
jgi:hypothetical protein